MPEEGGLYQIGTDDYTLYTGRQGFDDFQRVIQEHYENGITMDGVSDHIDTSFEPRRITPIPPTYQFRSVLDMESSINLPVGSLGIVNETTYVYDGDNWIAQVNTPNRISVEVNGTEHWYDIEEERELRNFMSQQRTAARLHIEQGLVGRSLVEELRDLQDERNVADLTLASQIALASSKTKAMNLLNKEEKETNFLGNIE